MRVPKKRKKKGKKKKEIPRRGSSNAMWIRPDMRLSLSTKKKKRRMHQNMRKRGEKKEWTGTVGRDVSGPSACGGEGKKEKKAGKTKPISKEKRKGRW